MLYAILAGLKPVYLHQEGLHEIDPLCDLSVWRERVQSGPAIAPLLEEFERSRHEQVNEEWRRAVQYVEEYTMGVNESSSRSLLEELGCTQPAVEAAEVSAVG